ncbi:MULTISPECIES: DinB family protein [Flavobacterium]|uniref:DinB family protein n=1 Tax=Flavobacterium TaxID=237 RepID=UPI001182F440|nr:MULTISPECIES: DinB family protein [Flavobacterium]MCR4029301.1 DinB family protein [Flavobacterium panacis]
MQSEEFIERILEQTRQIINQAEKLKDYDLNALTWRRNESSWSILECLEHLNLYGDYYLPEIESEIKKSVTKTDFEFKSGILGNYFANSMLPKGKLNKMKTFKDKNPLNTKLDKSVIDRFLNQQIKLLDLLNQSRNVSLNKVKIKISISKFIRLKLGDTFHFFVNHNIRHFNQIDQIQVEMRNSKVL